MEIFRGRQTIGHLLVGIGVSAGAMGLFAMSAATAVKVGGTYAIVREIEDALAGGDLMDGFRDLLEVFAGVLVGAGLGFLLGLI